MFSISNQLSSVKIYVGSVLFSVGAVVTLVLFTPVALVAYVLPYPRRYVLIRQWSRSVLWWLKITCNLTHKVEGLENLPFGPAIVFSNHQSVWETFFLQQIIPPMAWVLKRELLWIPFFGWCLFLLEPIAIHRKAGRKALHILLKEGKKRLAKGRWIVVFPEGTRVAPGQSGRYAIGGAMLAEKTGVSVVPIAHNAGEYWGKRSFLKMPGVIRVVVGPPISTVGRRADEINAEVKTWIEGTFKVRSEGTP